MTVRCDVPRMKWHAYYVATEVAKVHINQWMSPERLKVAAVSSSSVEIVRSRPNLCREVGHPGYLVARKNR